MAFNWVRLTRWQRFKRFWNYYINPWRPCVVCGKRFYNSDFWRWYSIKWGIPEYCSKACCDEEMDSLGS